MRLLVYSDAPHVGGAEKALAYLLGALRDDIEVGAAAVEPAVTRLLAAARPGVVTATLRAPGGLGDRSAVGEHRSAINAFDPDVIHINQGWPWAGAAAHLAALGQPGVRTIAVHHLPMSVALPRRELPVRRALARRAAAHVAVGRSAAAEIERLVGLAPGTVLAIPNAVPRRPAVPRRRSPDGPVVIGTTGRLTHQKGFDLLIAALARLPGAVLRVVGDGPEREPLQALAGEHGVSDRVHLLGWRDDPVAELAGADVFALPSRFEGMPLAILEAMDAGLPVVAAAVGSVPELVIDGVTGYLVASEDLNGLVDRLGRLIADAGLRRRLGEAGRARVATELTLESMARRYESVYTGASR